MTDTDTQRITFVIEALQSLKAKQITQLDVSDLTSIADHMIIASGTSGRHLKALASTLVEEVKANGEQPLGVEGQDSGEWVLVDLGDLIVHLMLPPVREYYDLERLWQISPDNRREDH